LSDARKDHGPGGAPVILQFGIPTGDCLQRLAELWFDAVMVIVDGVVTGAQGSLGDSALRPFVGEAVVWLSGDPVEPSDHPLGEPREGHYESWIDPGTGTMVPVEVSEAHHHGPEGLVRVIALRDISERRNAEQALRLTREEVDRRLIDLEAAQERQ